MLIPGGNDLISRFLLEYGEWAHLEVLFLADNIDENARILDMGAYLGTFGAGLSQVKSVESVAFFEANTNVVPALKYNVSANCKAKATICNAVVAPENFDRQFGYLERGNLGSLSFAANPRINSVAVALPARKITLRKALEVNPDVDLVKLDIEGMEYPILEEAKDIIKNLNTSFWIECNDNAEAFNSAELLLQSSYQLYYFAFPSYNPENYNKSKKVIFPMAYEAGLLASRRRATMSEHLSKLGSIGKSVANTEELAEALRLTPRWIPERWQHLLPPEIIAVALRELQESSDQASTSVIKSEAFREAHDEALARLETLAAEKGLLAQKLEAIANVRSQLLGDIDSLTARIENLRSSKEAAEAELQTSLHEKARLDAKLRHKVAELRASARRIEAVESAALEKVAAAENAVQAKVAAAENAALEKVAAAENAAREKIAAVEGAFRASEARAEFFEARLRDALGNPVWNLRRHLRWRASRLLLTFEPLLGESFSKRMRRRMQKNAPDSLSLSFRRAPTPDKPQIGRSHPVLLKAKRPKSLRGMPNWLAYRILKTASRQKWLLSERSRQKILKSANKRAANLNTVARLRYVSTDAAAEPLTAAATAPPALASLEPQEAAPIPFQETEASPDATHSVVPEAVTVPREVDNHPIGFRAEALANLRPLNDVIAEWIDNSERRKLDRQDVLEALRRSLQKSNGSGVIALSHDIYRKSVGGTQLCQLIEEAAFARPGVSYINVCPAQPLPVLSPEDDPASFDYHVTLDGDCLGYVSAQDLLDALAAETRQGSRFGLTVHSLLGHSPEITAELYAASSAKQAFFWLHDYFSVCPSYNLMRNSITSCGGPAYGSPACNICTFGEHRGAHLQRFKFLFSKIPFVVVAPSEVALKVWKGASDLPSAGTLIREHCTIEQSDTGPRDAAGDRSGPIRVAFLGMPSYPKGWNLFTEAVKIAADSPDFEFHHFGSYESWRPPKGVSFTQVSMTAQDWSVMSRAVREKQIDVAMLCSPWSETYNFTAMEAIVGGALIVTLRRSGNITAITRKFDRGIVFDDEEALCRAFADSSLATEVRQRLRQDRPSFQSSFANMSADLISLGRRSES
jgi:FkbM family methyltransferase